MRIPLLASFCAIIFLGAFARADDSHCWERGPVIQKGAQELLNGSSAFIRALYCSTPKETDKKAIDIWVQLIGLDKYTDRKSLAGTLPGLDIYLQKKIQSWPGIATELFGLYNEFLGIEAEIPVKAYIGIDEGAGKGRFARLRPGDLWKRLKRITNSDPRKALTIIALANSSLDEPLFLAGDFPGGGFRFDLRKDPALLPRYLDESLDISELFKEKIKASYKQNGEEFEEGVRAKAYHFHIAAFMSCEMLSTGASSTFVQQLQLTTALGYRMATLKAELQRLRSQREKNQLLSEHDQISSDAFELIGARVDEKVPNEIRDFFSLPMADSRFILNPLSRLQTETSKKILEIRAKLGIPDVRKEKAYLRLLHWLIERDWTIEQHMVGYNFALKVCKEKTN